MAFAEPPAWYVISLRPQGEHAALRRAAARHGAGLIALSPWRLRNLQGEQVSATLGRALQAQRVVFTSPAAVRAAAALRTLRRLPGQHWFAVGSGTARALARAGVAEVEWPRRMDSEGLLSLPGLAQPAGLRIGLVTAPDGRQVLLPALEARGAQVLRADVYERQPVRLTAQALRRLRELDRPACVALSSEAALARVLEQLPSDLLPRFQSTPTMAASARLAQGARMAGMQQVATAQGPQAAQLVAAMQRSFR